MATHKKIKKYLGLFMLLLGAAGIQPALAAPGSVADGLRVWLRADLGVAASHGMPVLVWADQSGNGSDALYDAANSFGEQPPVYVASNADAGGQPTVRFLNRHALEIDLDWLAGSDYTIFVVNGRDRFGLANFYIAGQSATTDQNLVLGYERTDLLRQAHFNNDLDAIVENYAGDPIWSLDTFRFAQAQGRDLFHNGALVASDTNTMPLISNPGATLGHFRAFGSLFWFQGDLAEVVVYDRALDDDERLRIEAELAGRNGRSLDIADYVPCNGAWENHGAYTDALAHAAQIFRDAGLLSDETTGQVIAASTRSRCGR